MYSFSKCIKPIFLQNFSIYGSLVIKLNTLGRSFILLFETDDSKVDGC